jgi:transcriptional regulator with XRE-family HTH domain
MGSSTNFGGFVKAKRMALGLSLREFCRQNSLDWGNLSRIERGVSQPPKSREVLENLAHALRIEEGSEDWQTFMELAAISAGRIPDRIMNDEELLAKLPLVFRTIEGRKLTPDELRDLAETIRDA